MSSSLLIKSINLEISTSPKYLRKILPAPKLAHPTTPVLKFGKTSLTESKVTCGLLDVYFTKWQHWSLHLLLEICLDYTKKYAQAYSIEFHSSFQMIFRQLLVLSSNLIPRRGQILTNSSPTPLSINTTKVLLKRKSPKNAMLILFFKLSSTTLVTSRGWKIIFPKLTISRRSKKKIRRLKASRVSENNLILRSRRKKKRRRKKLKRKRKKLKKRRKKRRRNLKIVKISWRSTWRKGEKLKKDKEKNSSSFSKSITNNYWKRKIEFCQLVD